MTLILYTIAAASMICGGIFSVIHGIYAGKDNKIKEKVAEFFRNALIQVSAILCGLSTALLMFNIQADERAADVKKSEKSLAFSAIGLRAAKIERTVKAFKLANKPEYFFPGCAYSRVIYNNNLQKPNTWLKELDNACKKEVLNTMRRIADVPQIMRQNFQEISESIDIKEDWLKYFYFSKNIDSGILQKFSELNNKLEIRENRILSFSERFASENIDEYDLDSPTGISIALSAIEQFRQELEFYTKSLIIYATMYYVTFGDIDRDSDAIEGAQRIFSFEMKKNNDMLENLNLNNFVNRVSQSVLDCKFQQFSCYNLVTRFAEDYRWRIP